MVFHYKPSIFWVPLFLERSIFSLLVAKSPPENRHLATACHTRSLDMKEVRLSLATVCVIFFFGEEKTGSVPQDVYIYT